MAHSHNDATKACCRSKKLYSSVYQTIDEMTFERGLWKAAMDNDIERVKMLLAKGHDPKVGDSYGYTPLHYAARGGHFHVSELLLKHGAKVDAVTSSKQATALHRAASQGHFKIIELLLRFNANTNLKDVDGNTALHRALSQLANSKHILQESSISTCKLLLPRTNLNIRNTFGETLKESIVKFFEKIKNEAGVNVADMVNHFLFSMILNEKDNETTELIVLHNRIKNMIKATNQE